jgi:sugar lactone lactonase YvrE
MNLKRTLLRLLPVAGAISLIGSAMPLSSVAAAPAYQVIATGLNTPRGLEFDASGHLYVAEAGMGGSGRCVASPENPDDSSCFGLTGSITRIYGGRQQRIVTGLPSMAGAGGSFASGPHDVAVMRPGLFKVVLGLGGNARGRDALGGPASSLGHLVEVSTKQPGLMGRVDWDSRVDLAAYEAVHNPDGGENDTNPYAAVADPAGNAVVADAGGNDLLKVDRTGKISTLAVFPDRMVDAPAFLGMPAGSTIPMQSVPNSVARGKHGEYYVGELTGFPFPAGAARVYVVRDTANARPEVFADGFTNIIDVATDKDGNLYVLEIARDGLLAADENSPTGRLTRISADGERTVLMTDGLVAPTGLAIGHDNALYVSNYGVFAGSGEVIRIPL